MKNEKKFIEWRSLNYTSLVKWFLEEFDDEFNDFTIRCYKEMVGD